MKKRHLFLPAVLATTVLSCHNGGKDTASRNFDKGTFGYDHAFLQQHDSGLVVLSNGQGNARVIVSPKYQAKVFTSTAKGPGGLSFGWVHYPAFSGPADAHMNAYGGENRFWLGPEGGKYSLFFKPGAKMVFDNWHTPAPFDTESWEVTGRQDSTAVTLHKDMQLENYRGSHLSIGVDRKITLLDRTAIDGKFGLPDNDAVSVVGYRTDNTITNTGSFAWTEKTGMPCIWILDMFNPSPKTVIVVPFHPGGKTRIATTDYFGEIPADRLKYLDSMLLFKADGKARGKLGLTAQRAKGVEGSYDPTRHVLTVLTCQLDPAARYLNQQWDTVKAVFSGDAQNAYNDGPLADGSQMGPFYEMESVSPAAALNPGASLSHSQSVFHFTGAERDLDPIARKILGISLDRITHTSW